METLSSMGKMWASLIGMGLMAVASLLILFARTKTKGLIRVALSIVAFVLLAYGLLYAIVSMT